MNRTAAMIIPIRITSHRLRLSPALKAFVRKKAAAMARLVPEALAIEAVLQREPGASKASQFTASARLTLPERDLYGVATGPDLHAVVNRLMARLAREAPKRKTRLAQGFSHPASPPFPSPTPTKPKGNSHDLSRPSAPQSEPSRTLDSVLHRAARLARHQAVA
jgi:ribosomal subunit interface protein